MNQLFKKMGDRQAVDLLSYIVQIIDDHPEIDVYIGCDSQNHSKSTVYVSTVLLRYPNNGAQVLFKLEREKKNKDIWSRLWAEVERSVDLGLLLRDRGVDVKQIDMDYNTCPTYASHKVGVAAMGYVESLGFTAKRKPNLLMAVWAANLLCQ